MIALPLHWNEIADATGRHYGPGEPRVSVDVWSGTIEPRAAERHVEKLAAEPEWGVQGLILTDLTGIAEESRPSADTLRHVAAIFVERMGDRVRDAKWAVVADVTFEDATRFSHYVEATAPRMIVFNQLTTACTWLGINESDVRTIIEEIRTD